MPMLLVPLNYTLKTVSYMMCILCYNEKLPLASSHTPQKKRMYSTYAYIGSTNTKIRYLHADHWSKSCVNNSSFNLHNTQHDVSNVIVPIIYGWIHWNGETNQSSWGQHFICGRAGLETNTRDSRSGVWALNSHSSDYVHHLHNHDVQGIRARCTVLSHFIF